MQLGKELQQMKLCGYCAGAPMMAKPTESHLRCPGGTCGCAAVYHQPDDAVRRSQAMYCHVDVDRVIERDPGFDDDDIRLLQLKEAHGMTTDQTVAVSEAEKIALAEAEKMTLPKLRAALSKANVEGAARMGKLEAAKAYVSAVAAGKIAEAKADRASQLDEVQRNKEKKMAKATNKKSTSKPTIPLSKLGFKEGETVVIDKANRFKLERGAKVKVLSAIQAGANVKVEIDGGKDAKGFVRADRVVSVKDFNPEKPERGANLKRGAKAAKKQPAKKTPAKKGGTKKTPAKKTAPAKKANAAAAAKNGTAQAVAKRGARKTVKRRA